MKYLEKFEILDDPIELIDKDFGTMDVDDIIEHIKKIVSSSKKEYDFEHINRYNTIGLLFKIKDILNSKITIKITGFETKLTSITLYYENDNTNQLYLGIATNLREIINTFSKELPELFSFRVIKNMNETNKEEYRFVDFSESISKIRNFLDKFNVNYNEIDKTNNVDRNIDQVKIFEITKHSTEILIFERIHKESSSALVKIKFIQNKNGNDINWGKFVKTLEKLGEYISIYSPEMLTMKALNTINENNNIDINKEFSGKFYETLDIITDFLIYSKISFTKKLGVSNIYILNLYYPDDIETSINILVIKHKHTNFSILNEVQIHYTPDDESLDKKEICKNINDIISFISKYAPELITTNLYKQINK